jgi:hypothetical protein
MDLQYDPPPGDPSPPLVEQSPGGLGWILGSLLVAGVVAYFAHFLGWL